jgi:hypothetical protein
MDRGISNLIPLVMQKELVPSVIKPFHPITIIINNYKDFSSDHKLEKARIK